MSTTSDTAAAMPSAEAAANDIAGPLLGPWLKGYPPAAEPVRLSQIAERGWNILAGDLPLPVAVLKRSALEHNIAWLQAFARQRGIDLAPHGKTTMSPQLFQRQLDAGAWGITFATVFQLRVGVLAGVRRALIANQVQTAPDLAGLAALLQQYAGLRVAFLVDSRDQLRLIEAWHARQPAPAPRFEVLLEIGVANGRTGMRDHDDAMLLARALRASPAVRLVGVECYEGLAIAGDSPRDEAGVDALMQRVATLAQACAAEELFEADEVIVSAGGSAVFDLVAARLSVPLGKPVRALLRSGCYVTHDHGHYRRLVDLVVQRCGCADGLLPALEVWTTVQSAPEAGLALLTGGRRDLSFDIEMPHVVATAPTGNRHAEPADAAWRIVKLNDQHAHLSIGAGAQRQPRVGDLVGLGISHPCTTFDKWHWMPLVDDDYTVVGAVTIHF